MIERGFGWRPQPEDERDYRFSVRRKAGEPRVSEERFDDMDSGIRDQRSTNACVGFSVRCAVELRRKLDGFQHADLSALSAYWTARALNGFEDEDGGAYVRSGLKAAHKYGLPRETGWPFDPERVNDRPSAAAEIEGVTRADGHYERIATVGSVRAEDVLDALQARCPVVLGLEITRGFNNATGPDTIPAPRADDVVLGRHAVCLAGFDRGGERVRLINSWGRRWGDRGMGWLAVEWIAHGGTGDIHVLRPQVMGP